MIANSPAYEIGQWLSSQNPDWVLNGYSDWSIHIANEPPSPGNVITLYDALGLPLDTDQLDIERPTIQVRVRSEARKYNDGYQVHHEIKKMLSSNTMIVCETTTFQMIMMTSDFGSIGRDERGRNIGVSTFQCYRSVNSMEA